MQLIAIDFETYYDKEFSLKKLTIEEYIRDPRFEVIMAAVSVDGAPPQWHSGDHASMHFWLSQFDWENSAAVAHNAKFDMAILSWKFGLRPKLICDTQAMAAALFGLAESVSLAHTSERLGLGRKGDAVNSAAGIRREQMGPEWLNYYAAYCCNDAVLCYRAFQTMKRRFDAKEIMLIDWTTRCFTEPKLVVNEPLAATALTKYLCERDSLLTMAGLSLEDIRSDDKLAYALQQRGVDPPRKWSEKQQKEVWAFAKSDIEFVDLAETLDDPVAIAAVEARLGAKSSIVESRLRRFVDIARRGPMPFPLEYYGARATGRFSGTDKINLQNLNNRSPLRTAIEAPRGYLLMSADLSQIEARLNAWQSGQHDLLEDFATGRDPYASMAATVFGYAVAKETHPAERFVGKTAVLGCGYQCGGDKFHHMLMVASRREGITLHDESLAFAHSVVQAYRQRNYAIVAFWNACRDLLPQLGAKASGQIGPYRVVDGEIVLPSGLRLYYPNLRYDPNERQWVYDRRRFSGTVQSRLYGGALAENITQAVARCVMTDALLRVNQRFRVVGTVHDELLVLIPETADVGEATLFVRQCMTERPAWAPDLPLACDVHVGRNYGEIK